MERMSRFVFSYHCFTNVISHSSYHRSTEDTAGGARRGLYIGSITHLPVAAVAHSALQEQVVCNGMILNTFA